MIGNLLRAKYHAVAHIIHRATAMAVIADEYLGSCGCCGSFSSSAYTKIKTEKAKQYKKET